VSAADEPGGTDTETGAETGTEKEPADEKGEYENALWGFSASGPLSNPLLGEETVYAGGLERIIYAFEATSGEELWRVGADNFETSSYTMTLLGLDSTSVYAHTDVDMLQLDRETGRVAAENHDYPDPELMAITQGGIIGPNSDGYVSAYDSIDGPTRWESQVQDGYGGSARPVVGNDLIVFGTVSDYVDKPEAERDKDTRVFGIRLSNGEELWAFTPDDFVGRSAGIAYAIHDGVVAVSGDEGTVYGLSADSGELLWEQTIEREGSGSSAAQPVVVDGQFVLATGDVIALDPVDGSVRWQTAIEAGHITQHYPVVDGDIWVPADGFFEYTSVKQVTSDGNHVGTYEVPVAFETMPAVGDDRIYITHTDEMLRAYEASDIQASN